MYILLCVCHLLIYVVYFLRYPCVSLINWLHKKKEERDRDSILRRGFSLIGIIMWDIWVVNHGVNSSVTEKLKEEIENFYIWVTMAESRQTSCKMNLEKENSFSEEQTEKGTNSGCSVFCGGSKNFSASVDSVFGQHTPFATAAIMVYVAAMASSRQPYLTRILLPQQLFPVKKVVNLLLVPLLNLQGM
ncbi:hypothetical protein LguiA_008574 [Lonicera macranthoides]